MIKKPKIVLVFALLAICFLHFTGCGKKEVSQGKNDVIESKNVYPENGLPRDVDVTIKAIYPVTGYGKDHLAYAVETFQKRFPNVKIEVHYIEEGNVIYDNLIKSLVKGGKDEEMYDWFYNVGDRMQLVRMGKLEKQNELWERPLYDRPEIKVKDAVIADERAIFINGDLYGVSTAATIYGLFFNEKMFEEKGWNKQPKDWNEFVQLCQKIKDTGIYPMVMAGKHPYYFTYGWGAIPHEVGGEEYYDALFNYKPNVYISKPMVTMLERMEEFAKKGFFHPGTVSFDHIQSQMEFIQGTAAMITNATWIANEMKDVTPKGFKWGFMAFPGNNPGQDKVVLIKDSLTGFIWKNKPELVKKWVKEFNLWLLNLDVQLKFAQSGGMPSRLDFRKQFKKLEDISPSVISALEYLEKEKVRLVNDNVRARIISNPEMAKVTTLLRNGYVSILNGTKTARQVAEEVNEQYMKGLAAAR